MPSSGLNLRLLPRPFREQRFPKGALFPDKHELLRFEKVFGGFGAGTKLKESLNFRLLGAKSINVQHWPRDPHFLQSYLVLHFSTLQTVG